MLSFIFLSYGAYVRLLDSGLSLSACFPLDRHFSGHQLLNSFLSFHGHLLANSGFYSGWICWAYIFSRALEFEICKPLKVANSRLMCLLFGRCSLLMLYLHQCCFDIVEYIYK